MPDLQTRDVAYQHGDTHMLGMLVAPQGATRLPAVVLVHGGLDLLEFDWARAQPGSTVLICTGARDPMATAEQLNRLQAGMDDAGIDWEVNLYSGAVHAFTSKKSKNSPAPHLFAYDERAATRAWSATLRFLDEVFQARAV